MVAGGGAGAALRGGLWGCARGICGFGSGATAGCRGRAGELGCVLAAAGRAPAAPPGQGDGHRVAFSRLSPGAEGDVSAWPILHLQFRCFCWSDHALLANLLQQQVTPTRRPQAGRDAEQDLLSHHFQLPQLPSPGRFLRVSFRNTFRRGCIQVLKSMSRCPLPAVTIIALCPGPLVPTLSPCQSPSPEDFGAGLGAQSEGTLQGRARHRAPSAQHVPDIVPWDEEHGACPPSAEDALRPQRSGDLPPWNTSI